jgi:hypothetical protein
VCGVTRVGVVGHVEWVEFVTLDELPGPGQVARGRDSFTRAAGGGGVAAVVLAELGAQVDFYCALGSDDNGRAAADQLEQRGVSVHVAWREQETRRAIGLLVDGGERAVVTIGERMEPCGEDDLDYNRLQLAGGVYFTAGDAGALERSRAAAVVVETPFATAAPRSTRSSSARAIATSPTGRRSWRHARACSSPPTARREGAGGGRRKAAGRPLSPIGRVVTTTVAATRSPRASRWASRRECRSPPRRRWERVAVHARSRAPGGRDEADRVERCEHHRVAGGVSKGGHGFRTLR